MRKIKIDDFEGEHYVIIEEKHHMILREVQTKDSKDTWTDLWLVLNTSDHKWDTFKKSYLYVYAETFELALACAKGIDLVSESFEDVDDSE